MHRRQYLRAAGTLAGAGALAGCGQFGGADDDVAPGVSTQGIDSGMVAGMSRDRVAAVSYEFGWRTEGDRLGTNFFEATHDKEQKRYLLRSRDGGAHFVDFYAVGEAYRNTAPDDPTAENRFEVPHRDQSELRTLPAAVERIIDVWLSGYEYDAPEQRDEGIHLDIVGGQSQVPYRLTDPGGHLLVSEGGVVRKLAVAGTPVSDTDQGEPTPLDSHMEAQLTLDTGGIELTEPDWVAAARKSL